MQIAVFIDFDNIEIGVKTTLHNELDIALVLDALRERGEVVSKSAYGDWGRAGDHSRTMTEQAVHMVQRNVTPRGDKNGADINLVVDALEMAFTRPHINAFAIVGGDSDFMSLVEKLKQFGKRVLVVGGRSFTSGILQRNCHEFIAYENLLAGRRSKRSPGASGSRLSLAQGFKQVQRALKVLADRGVQPQLGPLKSTLLQLDPTFSERDYGTSSFRDFIQKLASQHKLSMTRIDQGYLVELNGDGGSDAGAEVAAEPEDAVDEVADAAPAGSGRSADGGPAPSGRSADGKSTSEAMDLLRRAVERLHDSRAGKPSYVRHLAQAMRGIDPDFDEERYGFRTLTELMHMGEREGIVRMQRDRQGAWRVTAVAAAANGEPGSTRMAVPSDEEGTADDADLEAAATEAAAALGHALPAEADEEPAASGEDATSDAGEDAEADGATRGGRKKKTQAKRKTAAKTRSKSTAKKKAGTTRSRAKKAAAKTDEPTGEELPTD